MINVMFMTNDSQLSKGKLIRPNCAKLENEKHIVHFGKEIFRLAWRPLNYKQNKMSFFANFMLCCVNLLFLCQSQM